jgi:hypothetical protein
LIAATFSLAEQLATRGGVGVLEYIVGVVVAAALAFVSLRLLLRAFRPTPST